MRTLTRVVTLALVALAFCAPGSSAASAGHTTALRVSAASSLTEAFGAIAASFEAARTGVHVELNFGGSQVLRAQIEQGAGVDVFAAADEAQMAPLVKSNLVGTPRVFAHNRLVAVASAKSGAVRALSDLGRPDVRLVVAGPAVPVGRYTTQLVARLASAGLFGDDFAARFNANVRSQETNVRAVLTKVSLGEADAGIVYRTDVGAAKDALVIEIPDPLNIVATYPVAVVTRSSSPDVAAAFVKLVVSPEGRAILQRFGFDE